MRLEQGPTESRRDTELALFRLTSTTVWSPRIRFNAEAELRLLSPPFSFASRVASSDPRSYLPLQHQFVLNEQVDLLGRFDRFNFDFDLGRARAVVGRQAITWGVTYFWPAMDLFAPFAPQRIDRDYKPGVDAIRLTLPTGSYSEVEFVGAVLGSSISEDWAAGFLSRFHLGRLDLGLMGGMFHGDTVGGAFWTTDIGGTGVRGEFTWTLSGDPNDERINRKRFIRGSLGIDRQLNPELLVSLELSWNGYGVSDPSEYLSLISSDRVLRGEVNALGRFYGGVSTSWQLHPLWMLSNAILINGSDSSALWVPTLGWSTGNDSELVFGGQVGIGKGIEQQMLQSEYGSVANTIFVGFRLYF